MLRVFLIVSAFAAMPGLAHAMNWEGHDDWMADLPQARQLQSIERKTVRPAAPPARQEHCTRRGEVGRVRPNPYETILPLCPERRSPAQ